MKRFMLVVGMIISCCVFNVYAADKPKKPAFGRDYILITSEPHLTPLVDEILSNVEAKAFRKTPKVKSQEPKKAFNHFCRGKDAQWSDIIFAAREMTKDEFAQCQERIGDIVRIKLGYEALVAVTTDKAASASLDLRTLFLALAKEVPDPKSKLTGKLIKNPYKSWKSLNVDLKKTPFKLLGPGKDSYAEDVLKYLAMEDGCRSWDWILDMKYIQRSYRLYRTICHTLRDDGHYVAASKEDSMLKRLNKHKGGIGIMGYNSWAKSKDGLYALSVDDLPPTPAAMSAGLYPLSRAYYAYIKVPGLQNVPGLAYVMEQLTQGKALTADGYLAKLGMVAMTDKEHKEQTTQAAELTPMKAPL